MNTCPIPCVFAGSANSYCVLPDLPQRTVIFPDEFPFELTCKIMQYLDKKERNRLRILSSEMKKLVERVYREEKNSTYFEHLSQMQEIRHSEKRKQVITILTLPITLPLLAAASIFSLGVSCMAMCTEEEDPCGGTVFLINTINTTFELAINGKREDDNQAGEDFCCW